MHIYTGDVDAAIRQMIEREKESEPKG